MSVTERREEGIVIVGAGLVGSLLACVLARRKYKVTVYERQHDFRKDSTVAPKSINLVLTARGLRAVAMLGEDILNEMLQIAVPVIGRGIHDEETATETYQPYGKDASECNHSISRFHLNKFLITKAEQAGATVHFGWRVAGVHFTSSAQEQEVAAELLLEAAQQQWGGAGTAGDSISSTQPEQLRVLCPALIGADGGGSAVRYAMRDAGLVDFSEELLEYGYQEMIFPKAADCSGVVPDFGGGYTLRKERLHIWPRGSHFLMALANLDGSFTGTIYMRSGTGAGAGAGALDGAAESDPSFAALKAGGPEVVRAFFERYYADAVPLLGGWDSVQRQFADNPVGLLGTVRTNQWAAGRVLLIGDAAHAIVPFFGQGTNCGFEDCLHLDQMLAQAEVGASGNAHVTGAALASVFARFSAARKRNGDAIAEMALDNFVEMRDRVGGERFLLMKAVENQIENRLPDKFRSRYAMVCYGGLGNVSYDVALRLGAVQQAILQQLVPDDGSVDDVAAVDMSRAEDLIEQRVVPVLRAWRIDLTTVSHDLDIPDGAVFSQHAGWDVPDGPALAHAGAKL